MPDTPLSDPPPRARRAAASAKSEQRIRDILRVAREVLAEQGYERATTIEIAQRLGISEATVFTYFSGKRELCVRVIGDWYDEIIAAIEAGMPTDQPVRAQLDFFIHTHLRLFLIQGTGLCALVLSEGRSKGQALGDSLLPLQRRYTAPLMALLARGQANGEIRSDLSLRLLRHLVLGPAEHLLWEVISHDRAAEPALDLEATSRSLVDVVWSAIAAPGSELAALRRMRDEVAAALRGADHDERN
ncbi:TetR/AcrR family transcriptional regulator [Piscinibacter sakaiensis]|uniref:TetR/AcrR family transcriptional regulator n=1 Tax=Piscinibacter sakaiensis TaxID=1547922 RepID=UPI003AB076BB